MIFQDKSSISTIGSGEEDRNMSQIPQIRLSRHKGIFITGIDTNVGKTILTATLGVALQKQGFRLGVMKPVETGIRQSTSELEADGLRLQRILSTDDPSDIVTSYQFADPLAPLAASRRVQQPIDFDRIKNRYQELSRTFDLLLVEGAGGVMVPLTEQHMVRDLISFLGLPCVVVCRPTLGGINHTLLTLEALRDRKIQVLAIALNHTTSPPTSDIEQLQLESTSQLIRELSRTPVVGPLPFEPLLATDWNQGVTNLVDDPAITQLIEILRT